MIPDCNFDFFHSPNIYIYISPRFASLAFSILLSRILSMARLPRESARKSRNSRRSALSLGFTHGAVCFRSRNGGQGGKEIYMYDVTSRSVSKLAGDLSTAFVDAAESNSDGTSSIDDSTFSTS